MRSPDQAAALTKVKHSIVATSTLIFAIAAQSAINWTGDHNREPNIITRYAHQMMSQVAAPSPAIQTIAMAAAFNGSISDPAIFRGTLARFGAVVNGGAA